MIVKQILDGKGHQVWSIGPDQSIYEALALMAEKNIGALVVMNEGQVVGIFSERDYARKVVLQGKSSRETPVHEAMSGRVVGVRPERTVDDCMALMTEKRIRHLPVMDDDRIMGVISIGDIVKAVISEKENLIGQLESYITTGNF